MTRVESHFIQVLIEGHFSVFNGDLRQTDGMFLRGLNPLNLKSDRKLFSPFNNTAGVIY